MGYDPTIDTVHFSIPMDPAWLDRFFFRTAERGTCYIVRKGRGKKGFEVEKQLLHTKYLHSWWSSMVFMRKNVLHYGECLHVNYSYHKWHLVSNAFNSSLPWDFDSLWEPVAEALKSFKLTRKQLQQMKESCILRRVDWSVNMKVGSCQVNDILKTMFRFKVQYQDRACIYGRDFETLMWGSKNSAFVIKAYNKSAEVKKHFMGPDATEKEKDFYLKHVEDLKDVLRFEVGFGTRWWSCDDVCCRRGLQQHMSNPGDFEVKHVMVDKSIDKAFPVSFEVDVKGALERRKKNLAKVRRNDEIDKQLQIEYNYAAKDRQAVGAFQINRVLHLSREKMMELHNRVFSQFETQGNSFDDAFDFNSVQEAIEKSELSMATRNALCNMVSRFWIKEYKEAKKYYPEKTFYRYKKLLLEQFGWDIRVKSSMNTGVMSMLAKQSRRVKFVVDGNTIKKLEQAMSGAQNEQV